MTTPTELVALRERVAGLTGADRETDARVAVIAGLNFGWCGDEGWSCGDRGCEGCGKPLGLHDERTSYPSDWEDDERLPRFTASVDAALAFVDRALPGRDLRIERGHLGPYASAIIGKSGPLGTFSIEGLGERPDDELPLAIVEAAIDALINSETGHDHE